MLVQGVLVLVTVMSLPNTSLAQKLVPVVFQLPRVVVPAARPTAVISPTYCFKPKVL